MPSANWRWFFEPQHSRLALDLGEEMLFLTPYTPSQLIPDALHGTAFCAEQAEFYTRCINELGKQLTLSDPQLVQIALNATALSFFALPRMPKSWYFSHSQSIVYSKPAKVCRLDTEQGAGLFVVVQAEERSSLVMLISDSLELGCNKRLAPFEAIKVMNDRLAPAPRAVNHAFTAA
ncbi:cell division protein ZapC [Ferrimonas sediminicola]|nr:cell division protein ZapC [Ferrimonas sediminicola]